MVENMFKVNAAISSELIEKFDDDKNTFYRFQNPNYEIEGEYEQSWGMIFSSAEEARECAEEWGLTEDEAVLPGKSCMPTFAEIMSWVYQFDQKNDVLLVFKGYDTRVTGHDGEYVAQYDSPIAVFSIEDAVKYYNDNF